MVKRIGKSKKRKGSSTPIEDKQSTTKYAFTSPVDDESSTTKYAFTSPLADKDANTKYAYVAREGDSEKGVTEELVAFESAVRGVLSSLTEAIHADVKRPKDADRLLSALVTSFGRELFALHVKKQNVRRMKS